jgi:hypothetical protein
MYTPGTILRLAREERKLSISDAKYLAKIRESAIIAIENDKYDRFPAAYMQTFLPSYADFLGVSHYRLAEAFKATLPEYGYLTRSLYSRTLRQISLAQSKLEYARNHPPLGARVASGVRAYGMRFAVTCVCIAFLAFSWSSLSSSLRSESSLLGSALAGRFVATPEDMRGVRFDELEQAPVGSRNDEMQTVRLASIIGVKIDMKSLAAIALKHTAEQRESASLARRNSAIDASSRSISSIASAILAETSERQTEKSMDAQAFARSIPAGNLTRSALAEQAAVLSGELRSEEIRGLAEATSLKSAPKAFAVVAPASVPSAFSEGASGFVSVASPAIRQTAHQSVFKLLPPVNLEAARRAALEALRIAREASAKRAEPSHLSPVETGAPSDGDDEDRSPDNADTTAGDEAPPASEDGRA